jgi:hypothetical protein
MPARRGAGGGSLVARLSGMPLAGRLTSVVVQSHPYAVCFPCLAIAEGVSEGEVRGAAQIAVIRDGLRVVRRECYRCAKVDDVLVKGEAGESGP